MKRLHALAAALGLMLGAVGAHAATDNATETFSVDVDAIVEFITTKQTSSATANISNWDVDDGNDESTATVIFRLVMNTDTTLTGTFDGPLTNTTTGEFLLTYANIQSDGDGATAVTAGGDGHNATTDLAHTGFASGIYSTNSGVGNASGDDAFGYIGGLATNASSANTPADNATGSGEVYGTTTEIFLNDATGITLTHISQDGAVLLTVMVRGFNGEDYGASSDFTEAPDTGTYTCDLTLTATSI